MVVIATHLPSAPVPAAHESSRLAASACASPASHVPRISSFAEERAELPSLTSSVVDADFQAMDQQDTSAILKAEATSAGPASIGLTGHALIRAASDGDQLQKPLEGQAEDAYSQVEPQSTALFIHSTGDGRPDLGRTNEHQQMTPSLLVAEEGDAAGHAPSPTSSSEDAPGSDYDETEHRGLPMDVTILADAEGQERSTEPLGEQDVADHTPSSVKDQAVEDRANGGDLQPTKDIENASKPDGPADAGACSQASEQATFEPTSRQNVVGGQNLMANTVLSESWQTAEAIQEDTQMDDGAATKVEQAPTSVQPETESFDAVSQQPQSTEATTRPGEGNAATSPKRPKLDDSISTPELPAPVQNGSTVNPTAPKTKQPVRKSDKPLAKPKATPKPRKESKAKASTSVALATPKEEGVEPELVPALGHVAGADAVATGSSDAGVLPDQIVLPAGQRPEVKAKKARKGPARPRKQPTKAAAAVPEMSPQIGPPFEASGTNSAPIYPLLLHEAAQHEALESAPAVPENDTELKGKGKPKAPSKAKAKARFGPADPVDASPAVVPTLLPIILPPLKKPVAKRSAASKKGKGPVAQLRPAQADDAVSELELEPVQQLPSISSFHPVHVYSREEENRTKNAALGALPHAEYGVHPTYRAAKDQQQQHQQQAPTDEPAPDLPTLNSNFTSSNIFTSMPPPQYPAQAYWPTRAEVMQHQNRGLSSLTSAVSMESETHWSSEASSAAVPGSSSSVTYEGTHEATSPTTVGNAAGSAAGDDVSEANSSFTPAEAFYQWELDPKIHPTGWRLPHFDVIDPDLLMTSMRHSTVWTFWDCYLPLGCRDQDMVMLSNDNVAFPCAAWNPCLFSAMLKRVIKNPNQVVAQILARGVEENRKKLGYKPLPCIWIDENWHATNLLLSFLHPIPTMFLPDRATCQLVMDLGLRYGVERAVAAATQRSHQIDDEDSMAARDKGKGRAREEDIAADLAERAA